MSFLFQTSAQQALTGTINSSMQAVQAAQASLSDSDTLPPLGTDAVRHTKHSTRYYATEIDIRFMVIIMIFLPSSDMFLYVRPLKPGGRTRWMSPNMKFILRWMPLLQEQHLWLI